MCASMPASPCLDNICTQPKAGQKLLLKHMAEGPVAQVMRQTCKECHSTAKAEWLIEPQHTSWAAMWFLVPCAHSCKLLLWLHNASRCRPQLCPALLQACQLYCMLHACVSPLRCCIVRRRRKERAALWWDTSMCLRMQAHIAQCLPSPANCRTVRCCLSSGSSLRSCQPSSPTPSLLLKS